MVTNIVTLALFQLTVFMLIATLCPCDLASQNGK
jgi:hypothetical protein